MSKNEYKIKFNECTNVYNYCENNFKIRNKSYTIEDVKNVWEQLSAWIVNCLKNNKSVIVKQLGTFTLSKYSLETGIRKELKISKPIFIISTSLQDDFYIYQIKNYVDQSVPVAVINYNDIALKCGCTKETVINCLDDIVKSIRKLLYENKNLLFEMPNLGVLTVKKGEADFIFTNDCLTIGKEPKSNCYRYKTSIMPYNQKIEIPCKFHLKTSL